MKIKVWFSGVTILLSLTIFLNTVSEIIPITSDSPLIGNFPTTACAHFLLSFSFPSFCSGSRVKLDRPPHPPVPHFTGAGTFFFAHHTLHRCIASKFWISPTIFFTEAHITGSQLFFGTVSFLGVAIMLSMTIFQSLIAETTPVSNSSPIIGIPTLRKKWRTNSWKYSVPKKMNV